MIMQIYFAGVGLPYTSRNNTVPTLQKNIAILHRRSSVQLLGGCNL